MERELEARGEMTVWEMLIELEKLDKDLEVYFDASRPHHRMFTYKSVESVDVAETVDTHEKFVLLLGGDEARPSEN